MIEIKNKKSPFVVFVEFINGKKYSYRCELAVDIGDIVYVTGALQEVQGTVVRIDYSSYALDNPYLKDVIKAYKRKVDKSNERSLIVEVRFEEDYLRRYIKIPIENVELYDMIIGVDYYNDIKYGYITGVFDKCLESLYDFFTVATYRSVENKNEEIYRNEHAEKRILSSLNKHVQNVSAFLRSSYSCSDEPLFIADDYCFGYSSSSSENHLINMGRLGDKNAIESLIDIYKKSNDRISQNRLKYWEGKL